MSDNNIPIESREYKLILDIDGILREGDRIDPVWKVLTRTMHDNGAELREKQHETEWRAVWYLDTADHALRARGYSCRIRNKADAKKPFELTLKRRSPDRYVAATSLGEDDRKFEEDVFPLFRVLFSNACKIRKSKVPSLRNLRELSKLFPILKGVRISGKEPIGIVGGLVAHELFCKLGKFKTGKKKDDFKASLAIWFPSRSKGGTPLIAELDFDLDSEFDDDDRLECFSAKAVSVGNAVFKALQAEECLVDPKLQSKTAWVYSLSGTRKEGTVGRKSRGRQDNHDVSSSS